MLVKCLTNQESLFVPVSQDMVSLIIATRSELTAADDFLFLRYASYTWLHRRSLFSGYLLPFERLHNT